jgi:Fe-S-cluster containining protein
MDPNQAPVHFACTACGKCCTSPPVVTVTEALGLYRDFALALKLGGPIADKRLAESNPAVQAYFAQRAHLQAHGAESFGLRLDAENQWEATLLAAALPLRAGPDDPCPMLDGGGLCRIYERRPQRCRAVPFDPWLPEAMAVADGRTRLAEAVARDWACDLAETAPVVAAEGHFTPGPYGEAYGAVLRLTDGEAPVMAVVAQQFHAQLQARPEMVAAVVQALMRRETIDFSFAMVLEALHAIAADPARRAGGREAILEKLPPLRDFLTAQIGLLDELVARNLARKRPQDRPYTERLRALAADYRRGLALMAPPAPAPAPPA